MGETYYDVLGVATDATQAEITAAYRERVLETHPDRNDDPDASTQFRRVTEAESVLSDETERARYDRLGHEEFLRWSTHFPQGDSSDPAGTTADTTDSARSTGGSSAAGFGGDGRATSTERAAGWAAGRARASADGERSGSSHHARHRYRRQRKRASASGWPFDGAATDPTDGRSDSAERTQRGSSRDGAGRTGEGTADATTTGTPGAAGSAWNRGAAGSARSRGAAGPTGDQGTSRARTRGESATTGTWSRYRPTGEDATRAGRRDGFAVHGWDDEIDLGNPYRTLDDRTAVVALCVTILYPLLVYSSITTQFPVVVNAIVAICTLVLVGYLLTMPRVALASFGLWSLVVPFALPRFTGADTLSLAGLLLVAAFWIPFGYAVAVWWALRP